MDINKSLQVRKESAFEITDRIAIHLTHSEYTDRAVNDYKDYICGQVLANTIDLSEHLQNPTILDFDEYTIQVEIEKV